MKYIRFLSIAVVMETVLVETELEEEKLVEVDELLEKEEDEELDDTDEKSAPPCMFLRYGQPHGPSRVVTTSAPSSTPYNEQ